MKQPAQKISKFDVVANMAHFMLKRKGSVFSTWTGRLTAKEQREMFGAFLGKGLLTIDGTAETIQHVVSACFGLDYNVTFSSRWSEIGSRVERALLPEFAGNGNRPRW